MKAGAKGWTGSSAGRGGGSAIASALAALLLALAIPTSAAAFAETSPELPTRWCEAGTGAGQCRVLNGIAANPRNGHVFVADAVNRRINEFNALGEFISAWGWGVVASGPSNKPPKNEIQILTVDATGGGFRLHGSHPTEFFPPAPPPPAPPIPFDASAAAVEAALAELAGAEQEQLTPGDVSVNGPDGGPWSIEFVGRRADLDMRQLRVVGSTLTGATATATVTTTQQGGNFEVCLLGNGDVCGQGQISDSPGGLRPSGMSLDSAGNVYVVDAADLRVQKFNSNGNFLLMFGGGVNETSGGNVCPRPGFPSDSCKVAAAATGNGPGEFSWSESRGDFIAVDEKGTDADADDVVYVGDAGRIQKFDTFGVYLGQIAVGGTVESLDVGPDGNLYRGGGTTVQKLSPTGETLTPTFKMPNLDGSEHSVSTAVAVDAARHVYAFGPTARDNGPHVCNGCPRDPIIEFDPAGQVIAEFGINEFSDSTGIEANLCPGSEAPGNLYVSNRNSDSPFVRAYGTAPIGCFKARTGPAKDVKETSATLTGTVIPSGLEVSECFFEWGTTNAYGQKAECEPKAGEIGGSDPVAVKATLSGLPKGTVHHFRLIAKVGPERETGSGKSFKTLGPPVISEERTVSVAYTEAALKALLNPEGFASTYRFQYTTQADFETEGFAGAQSTPEIALGKDGDRKEHAVAVNLSGLEPGTAYRWRVVAMNTSDTTNGSLHAFVTYRAPGAEPEACPNQAFRGGSSAKLPDCRAYEMVSPVDKNGGNIVSGMNTQGDPGGYIQAAPGGDAIAYTALFASFGGQQTSASFNEYLASRGPGGWTSEGIHPPISGRNCCSGFMAAQRETLGFSADLCNAWVFDFQTPPLMPDAQVGLQNLYRRGNCEPGAGELETLTDTPLPQDTGETYIINHEVLQGVSDDGSHALFLSRAPLLQDCRSTTTAKAVSYQWLRNGTSIPGATAILYRPTDEDRGTALQCQVFAINSNAGSTQVSNPASVIPPEAGVEIAPPTAPATIPAPTASATLTVGGPGGQTLTCDPKAAGWQGSPSFSYRWYRNGAAIAGAAASTYVTSAADLAASAVFQCAVTGANGDGAVTKVSNHRATSPGPSPAAPCGPKPPCVGNEASADAAGGGAMARVYDRFGGESHLASVLPGGRPADAEAQVGSGSEHNLHGAVSADGSHVYWTSGKLYLRLHPEQGIVASECADNATVACTLAVSGGPASFWAGSADGSRALYEEADATSGERKLIVFDLAKQEAGKTARRTVVADPSGVAGASEDLSRIYFFSNAALPGSGANSEGKEALEGRSNLYLDEEGAMSFVATLEEGDLATGAGTYPYSLGSRETYYRATRVTPGGSRIVFESRASLTGFDNADAESGRPSVEVFSYDATAHELSCVSCNPSGARPSGGREMPEPYRKEVSERLGTLVTAAAWIPTWEHPLHASNVVSADGSRIFFNANDALLPTDANGAPDVYEWEAPGAGSCEADDASYFAQNDGCLYLISSGESPQAAEFWEASPDGSDVFFTTSASLVPPDPGSTDLYDARVGGGFEYPEPQAQCEGEACQSPPEAPNDPTPASESFQGAGNVREEPALRHPKPCTKGKVKRHGKCVAKHHKRHRRAKHGRRAGR